MSRYPFLFLFFLVLYIYYSGMAQEQSLKSYIKFQSYQVAPVSLIQVKENHYFIDFGKDAFGTVVLFAESQQTDTILNQI